MKTLLRLVLSVILIVIAATSAAAQTVDEIVEKHLAALGGRAALAALTSRIVTGTITASTPGGDVSGSLQIFSAAPNKQRTLVKLDLSRFNLGEMTLDQRFDGSAGYVIDTMQGNREMTGDQLEAARNAAFPTPLLSYRERGIAIELAGREKLGDREVFVLVLKPKTGPASTQYIDVQTYLPVKQVVKATLAGAGELEQVTEFLGYRQVDGFAVPTEVRNVSALQQSTILITNVEHNAQVDPAMFSKP